MFDNIRDWATRLESDPALKRRFAAKLVAGLVVSFAVAIGIVLFAGSGADQSRQPAQAAVEADGLPPNPDADDPQYHEKSRARHAALMEQKRQEEESARNWKIALVLVGGVVLLVAYFWISRVWSASHPQRQRRSDDPTNPVVAVLKGFVYLILFLSGPVGWLLAYLWHREESQNRERLAIAEAFDELEREEHRRDRAMYAMAERLNELEQVRCPRCGSMNAAELVSCWHCELELGSER